MSGSRKHSARLLLPSGALWVRDTCLTSGSRKHSARLLLLSGALWVRDTHVGLAETLGKAPPAVGCSLGPGHVPHSLRWSPQMPGRRAPLLGVLWLRGSDVSPTMHEAEPPRSSIFKTSLSVAVIGHQGHYFYESGLDMHTCLSSSESEEPATTCNHWLVAIFMEVNALLTVPGNLQNVTKPQSRRLNLRAV